MTQDNQNNQSQVPNDPTNGQGADNSHHGATETEQVNSATLAYNPLENGYNPSSVRPNDADQRVNIKFGEKFKKNWDENGIFRVIVIVGTFITIVLLIVIFNFFFGGSNAPNQVDASKTKFDAPTTNAGQAEVVTPEQYQYIRAQEAILAQQAQKRGESFTPRNLVISNEAGAGQAVLPATTNATAGISANQVNGTLFNSTQNLNNGGLPQGQQIQGQNSQQPQQQGQYQQQPQFIQIPDNASPVASQYLQNNNEFASWYDQESQRQITENQKSQDTVNTFVLKQIQALSGTDDQGKKLDKNKSSYKSSTYAVPESQYNSDNGNNTGTGNGVNTGNGQNNGSNLNYGASNTANGVNSTKRILVPAGTRVSARLLNDVNTDDGDQVFAQIINSKLQGRKVLGNVKKTQDNIQFSMSRVLSDGKLPEFSIDGVGQTLQGSFGMATYIDRHILKNSAAMVASSAAKGYGNAYRDNWGNAQMSNGTVVVNQQEPSNKRIAGNIAGQLGEDFGSKIDSIYGNKATTFRTPVGTVFYIFINKDITE